eukprot:3994319-Pyramimonas_sp.AAC.1
MAVVSSCRSFFAAGLHDNWDGSPGRCGLTSAIGVVPKWMMPALRCIHQSSHQGEIPCKWPTTF